MSWVKSEINEFYSKFYDLLQEAGSVATDESASGEDKLLDYRNRVWEQLFSFATIVAPLVTAAPAAKWVRSVWAFAWRRALMTAYLQNWDIAREPIEGASQRLHEDTQRFANALQGCLATMLDAIFTIGVFTPILLQLSLQVASPSWLDWMRDVWLWVLALAAAVVGLVGAMLVGQKLVKLEIANQKVEAALRKACASSNQTIHNAKTASPEV